MNERLCKWAKDFIRHRDLFHRKLESIEDNENGFIAYYKNKKEIYIIEDILDFENIPKDADVCFVTLNNHKNFNKLLTEWKIIISFSNLKIIFVEKIASGKHWIINPYIHDRISDKSSLKSGLKTLFDNAKND